MALALLCSLVLVPRAPPGAAFAGGRAPRRETRGRSAPRVGRRASGGEGDLDRRGFLARVTSPNGIALSFWLLAGGIPWALTREEKVRKSKVCVRSKQFIDDYMADPMKTASLAAKGVPPEKMRSYLQGEDCLEFPEWLEQAKNAKAFWEVGEEYRIG